MKGDVKHRLMSVNRCKILLILSAIIVIFVLIYLGSYSFKNVMLTHHDGRIENVRFPYFRDGSQANQVYSFEITKRFYTQDWLKIYPDYCVEYIKVNGIKIGIPDDSKCVVWTGADINLGEHLDDGRNRVEIKISNLDGVKYGLALKHSLKDLKFVLFLSMIYLLTILLLVYLKREGLEIIFILMIICLVLRLSYVYLGTMPELYIYSDVAYYDSQAQALMEGKLFPPVATLWQPGYYIVLAGFYYLLKLVNLFDLRYTIIPLIHCILFSISLFFIYRVTQKIGDKVSASIASILYILYYPLIHLNVFMMSENLFFPFLALVIYLIVCKTEPGNCLSFFLLGLAIGIATDIRVILIGFIPFIFIWFISYRNRKEDLKRFALSLALLLIGILLCFAVQSTYNSIVTEGRAKFISSSGGLNFALAWCNLRGIEYRGIYVWGFGPPAMTDADSKKRMIVDVEFTNQSYYYQMGIKCLMARPNSILRQTNAIYKLFDSTVFPRFDNMFKVNLLIKIWKFIMLLILMPLSIFVLCKSVIRDEPMKKYIVLLWLMILSVILLIYISVPGEERYMFPFNFAFIIMGSLGLTAVFKYTKSIFDNFHNRKKRVRK